MKPVTTALLLMALCHPSWIPAAAAQTLVIANGRVLDGRGGTLERGTVVVRDGKIVSVSPDAVNVPGARVVDATGMTVLPGFIDGHRHPIGGSAAWLEGEARVRMQEFLDAGFTTVLSAGDDPTTALELRRRLADGAITGPRLIVAGRAPTAGQAPGGEGRGGGPRVDPARSDRSRAPRTEAAPAVPAEQTRATVEALAKSRVDAIKTNIIVTPGGPEQETLALIVREARRHNIPVVTHAVSVEDTLAAVRAGVQTLVHTPHIGHLTPEQARMIAQAGIPMISTLSVFVPVFDEENRPLFRDRQPFPWETLSSAGQGPVNARLLWEAGITYGYGTDTSWHPRESLAAELRALSLVFSPRDIVAILTRNAAVAIHRADQLGTLEPGKAADIVIVNGNPLDDSSALLNVRTVVRGGEIVVERR